MRVQRWAMPTVAEAEAVFAALGGLIGDDPALAALVFDAKGRDGRPTISAVWRSSDGVIREQIRSSLYPVEPIARQVEAALDEDRATHDHPEPSVEIRI
jgi:hypothetical protein